MQHLRFYFDVISPHAYVAFERLPQVLVALSYEVSYQPVERAGLLEYRNNRSSDVIDTQQAQEMAHQHGLELDLPAPYPFSPVALLCLALASARDGRTPSRHVCRSVLHHVWRGGGDADEAKRVQALARALKPNRDVTKDEIMQALQTATSDAASRGVFDVPAIEVDRRLFWGPDLAELLADYMRGKPGTVGRSNRKMDRPAGGAEPTEYA